ncbi:DUF2480 family protein [Polluticaenibacter yanchengensis]|uniref:DUF2480 family protein n=1 Tax=Polluticaenibacter yanchengensis TaxID=3014562 RepID=A0ABT4UPM2_9BACT|nr:DUF2480 family protein [Chitinophagaceae bacterium LY-5]
MQDEIVNKVALNQSLVTLDLEEFIPKDEDIIAFDIEPFLFMGMILKEKDFRESLKGHDWLVYKDRVVNVFCSADAIIPMWAYMLISSYLTPVTGDVFYGSKEQAKNDMFFRNLNNIALEDYAGKKLILKGCSDLLEKERAYLTATGIFLPVVNSLMFGEACSTVPIYKVKRAL